MKNNKESREGWLPDLTEIVGDAGKAREVLDFIDKQEELAKEWLREKQREGIRKAQKRGINVGRPSKQLPENYEFFYRDFINKNISAEQAAKYCDLGLSTFYRKVKAYKKKLAGDVSAAGQE